MPDLPPRLVVIGAQPPDDRQAGMSTCPLCSRTWLVTPRDDCLMPACGCYGFDATEANPNRPCETCGIRHAWTCVTPPESYDQGAPTGETHNFPTRVTPPEETKP